MGPVVKPFGLLRRADQPATPWRNGGGMTRQLAASGADGEPAWRVSVATIDTAGEFSTFAGVERHLTLVAGDRLELVVDGRARLLRRGESTSFPGEAPVVCALPAGAVEALNAMTRRGSEPLRVRRVDLRPGDPVRVGADAVAVLSGGAATVTDDHGVAGAELGHLDALLPWDGTERTVTGTGTVFVVHLP